jgi:FKBP-type peptidyl-prolyl cis-trans isomerase SlyD
MIVEEHCVVTVAYELRETNAEGPLLERMDANYPFKFLFGTGKLLPAFEAHLEGLEEGAGFEFTLSPQEGYGPVIKGNIMEVPREIFIVDGAEVPNMLIKGNYVTLTDDYGQPHNGCIVDFNDQSVTVDFNHAMAGKTLHFKGGILNIRKATVDELIRKHYIEEDGVHYEDEEW